MIAYSSRDAVDASFGADGRMLKRVNAGTVAQPSAGALYLSGPESTNNGETSLAFTVSADGQINGSIVVTLAVSNALGLPAGTLSAATVTLTPAATYQTFTFAPANEGGCTITATASGMTAASIDCDVLPAASPAVAVPSWKFWLDPAQAWESAAPTNYDGEQNQIRIQTEFQGAAGPGTITNCDTWKAAGTYEDTSAGGVQLTSTEMRRGMVSGPPRYVMMRRVTDPADAGRTVFESRLDQAETGWVSGTSFRAELNPNGAASRVPWDTDVWLVVGAYFNASWLQGRPQSGYYNIFSQAHDFGGGLGGNPPIALQVQGGDGDAANATVTYIIRRYAGTGWPDAPQKGSVTRQQGVLVAAPAAETHHYFVIHYRAGCGYADPTLGDIYGATADSSAYFVDIYHAEDTGPPVMRARYSGFWGSPFDPTTTTGQTSAADVTGGRNNRGPYWKLGQYIKTNFQPSAAGTDRTLMSRGMKQWITADNHGIDVWSVLEDFRG